MILGNRALFVIFVGVSAVLAGCGGGGGGTGPSNPSTATPTSTPTVGPTASPVPSATATVPATPTPTPAPTFTPTPQPAGTVLNVPARPLTAGDTFAYSGSLIDNFIYSGQSSSGETPIPNSTTDYTVTQTVTDEGTTPFDGASPYDLRTAETDASPHQTIAMTTDTYLLNGTPSGGKTGFYTYGYKSSDSFGQNITETLAGVPGTSSPNGLLDVLPETQNAHWSNTGAGTMAESEADGFSASRVTAANGTYVENDVYPQPSNYTPAPAPLTASITENSDGSGSYSFPFGGATPNAVVDVTPPDSSGMITVSLGDGTPSDAITYVVSNWYGTAPLYAEYDHQDGELPYPSACHVPSAFGTTGDGVEQKFTKVDTVLGTLENFDQLTYVNGGYAVCTTLKDVTQVFYDYSGQGQSDTGIDFNGAGDPAEVATITSTLGLTSTSVTPAFRRTDITSKALDVSNSARVASARTNFLAVVERRRLDRIHRTARHLRTMHTLRAHR